MFIRLFVFLLSISCLADKNQIKENYDNCEISFKNIKIRDFHLRVNKDDIDIIRNESITFIEKPISQNEIILTFDEDFYVFNEKRKIKYKLLFKEDILIGYDFLVEVERGKRGIEYFKSIINNLKKDSINDFIKGNKYVYMNTSETCKRFIRMHSIGFKKYIYGGCQLL